MKPCMICGKICTTTTYMPMPSTVEQVHEQLREKTWMERKPSEEKPKPIRRGKQGIARRDGPSLF